MIRVDTATLSDIISRCFDLVSDARLTPEQQQAFLVDGRRLRGSLLSLLSARFDDGTPEVLQANLQLANTDAELEQAEVSLENISDRLSDLANLVGFIDKLLNQALPFL